MQMKTKISWLLNVSSTGTPTSGLLTLQQKNNVYICTTMLVHVLLVATVPWLQLVVWFLGAT